MGWKIELRECWKKKGKISQEQRCQKYNKTQVFMKPFSCLTCTYILNLKLFSLFPKYLTNAFESFPIEFKTNLSLHARKTSRFLLRSFLS